MCSRSVKIEKQPERETIHSGHFMVSHFEAEEQDDEDEVAVPVPEEHHSDVTTIIPAKQFAAGSKELLRTSSQQHLEIDTSLSKLFQCMTLAYRQKLTSPKWNRFRGIRLRWKEKIRLNNVIWRCWHLQFIKKENTLICQFASPLDVDIHNKPEAVVLEGKYWKRKLHAVTAEYKKWRLFHRHQILRENHDAQLNEVDLWTSQSSENVNMLVDEDYMGLMSDTLFSTITNQPFAFPDSREIAKAGLADFIQPSLGPLQPNLDDYMDTFDQELLLSKLPTVPEEHVDTLYKWPYPDLELNATNSLQDVSPSPQMVQFDQQQSFNETIQIPSFPQRQLPNTAPPSYPLSVISKTKDLKNSQMIKFNDGQELYENFQSAAHNSSVPSLNSGVSLIGFKSSQPGVSERQGYKFPTPSARPKLEFHDEQVQNTSGLSLPMHSLPVSHNNYSYPSSTSFSLEEKTNRTKTRFRSRSSTREPTKRPPLVSTISDSDLMSHTCSVLLTQLSKSSNDRQSSSSLITQLLSNNASDQTGIFNRDQQVKSEKTTSFFCEPSASSLVTPPVAFISGPSPDTSLLSYSASNSPGLDVSQCLNSPTSSQDSVGSPPGRETGKDQRRVCHIHAEQKRRYNIKNGFDVIHSLIPHLNQNPNSKLSKAAMLQKGAEYIRQLKQEREQLKEEMDGLRQQIETLNTSISNCQSMLPTNVAPIKIRRDGKMQEMFDDYVRNRTMENWKFWIFSLIFRPLLISFNNVVSTSSIEDLYRSTLLWIEQHCTLGELRPVVLNSLRFLCTKTEVLSEPEKLPDEARQLCTSNLSNKNK